jgi:hypothetical protein
MDYIFTITEYNSADIDQAFAVNHGRLEHWFDLQAMTYYTVAYGDNVAPVRTDMNWLQNVGNGKIYYYLDLEIERVKKQLLQYKARVYELINFIGLMTGLGPQDTVANAEADVAAETATLEFLVNYKKNLKNE